MKLFEHFDKENLHHAYLIEGVREEVVPEILTLLGTMGMQTSGNPDFLELNLDSFKIEDARNLKSYTTDMSFSSQKNAKKIFIISANSFLLEAQNAMLKMFEEPVENTHFFIIVPDADTLLKTFLSRFYVVYGEQNLKKELGEAEKFISMSLQLRINFLKELLVEPGESEEVSLIDSAKPKAIKFLNAVETVLHKKLKNLPVSCFKQIFKVREFLRQPGSSAKNLMESVALAIPVIDGVPYSNSTRTLNK